MKNTDRKLEIINCAAKLFKEKGYSAVTMRDIAQAMNIKAASLYNHINSKQEILVLIIINIAEEFTSVMNEILLCNCSSIEKVKKVIDLHIDITLRNPEALACLNNDWMHLTDRELAYFMKMRQEYEDSFRAIVKSGILKNEILNINIEVVIFSTLSTLRTLYIWYDKTKNLNEKILKVNLKKALLNGII